MTTENSKRYDAIPYESHPFHASHPRWLATVAAVFGMSPPALDGARILELGCASGGNLLPMAESIPNSKCVGIDLSGVQVADGQALIKASGLSNIELKLASILDVDESYGQFDYILCHGVYSWVTRDVQQKILEICNQRLKPNGLAYVSYNTYPGWHMKGMLRDMMKFHAARFKDPKQQIAQSRALLNVLAKTVPSEDNPFGMLLKKESEQIRKASDWYIYHEQLEVENDPVYFHEFAQRAHDVGLQFLGESELRAMLTNQFSPEIQAALKEVATGIVYAEQYMDFFRNRTFRQTILCKNDIKLNRKLNAASFRNFSFASPLKPVSDLAGLSTSEPFKFAREGWPTPTVVNPIAKASLLELGAVWPQYVSVPELLTRVRTRLGLGANLPTEELDFTEMLWTWFTQGLVKMTHTKPSVVSTVSELPLASTVARAQAKLGKLPLANLHHRIAPLAPFDVKVVSLLDGSHTVPQLIELLRNDPATMALAGEDLQSSPEALPKRLDVALLRLAEAALLLS